jgi:HTH-type transcriptional regulator / antitoxin HipB
VPPSTTTGGFIPIINTPPEVASALASRVRALRLARGWSRGVLAEKAGVSEATIKAFERTGQITLSRLLLLARALDALAPFAGLFAPPVARTLDELEARQKPRQRGRRRK